VLLNANAPAVVPAQKAWLAGTVTIGLGDTFTVNDCTAPVQVAAVGVTAITAVAVTVLVLVAVKAAMLPDPDAPRPMVVFVLAHA